MSRYRALPASLIDWVAKNELCVLRNEKGVALNVSYTEEGLKWTCNKYGRSLYYRDAYVVNGKIVGKDLRPSKSIRVEKFVPTNFDPYVRDSSGEPIVDNQTGNNVLHSGNVFKQSAEATWVEKAIRLINFY